MLKAPTEFIIIFIIVSVILVLVLAVFISIIIYKYQQKQNIYFKEIEELKILHENSLLQAQLEIQEQTIQNISKEIHDNIGQKLSLAKLHLNTLIYQGRESKNNVLDESVAIIGDVITELTDISRSMNNEILLNNGLLKALEYEGKILEQSGKFSFTLSVKGSPVFLEASIELILFRIAQEAIANILKHAMASRIEININYGQEKLSMCVSDNGNGFNGQSSSSGTGLLNMKKRAQSLKGMLAVESQPGKGTCIKVEIPTHEQQ